MKLSVEIKDEKFSYEFDVGGEKGHGDRPLNAYGLRLFSAIIEDCHKSWAYETKKELIELECSVYLEKHPELIDKYIKGKKGKV
jgi:hypothetical protein